LLGWKPMPLLTRAGSGERSDARARIDCRPPTHPPPFPPLAPAPADGTQWWIAFSAPSGYGAENLGAFSPDQENHRPREPASAAGSHRAGAPRRIARRRRARPPFASLYNRSLTLPARPRTVAHT